MAFYKTTTSQKKEALKMHDITWILDWAWAVLSIPFIWMYKRVDSVSKKADDAKKMSAETRVILAERHYTKTEVESLVDRTVRPIHDKLNEISDDVKLLIHREMK